MNNACKAEIAPANRTPRKVDVNSRLLAILAIVLVSGCTNANVHHASGTANVAGSYRGKVSDTHIGTGFVETTLVQSGTKITGTFVTRFERGHKKNDNFGEISGDVVGDSVTMVTKSSRPHVCAVTLKATATDSTIAGTYATEKCATPDDGRITLTRL